MISASEARKKTEVKRGELDQELLNSKLVEVERRILTAIDLGAYSLTYYFKTKQDLDCSDRLIGALVSFGYKVIDYRFREYDYGTDYSDEPNIYINWFD